MLDIEPIRNGSILQAMTLCIFITQPVSGQGGDPDGFCLTPGPLSSCQTYLVTETALPVLGGNDGPLLGAEWKIGLMVNVRPAHSIGGAATLVGEDRDYRYSGLEVRYRRSSDSGLAAEAVLGGAWVRPLEATVGSEHFRTQLRIGLWMNEYVGAFFGGKNGDGEQGLTGGPQIGSWPGLLLGGVLVGLFIGLQ